jgi:hypothetical protein
MGWFGDSNSAPAQASNDVRVESSAPLIGIIEYKSLIVQQLL